MTRLDLLQDANRPAIPGDLSQATQTSSAIPQDVSPINTGLPFLDNIAKQTEADSKVKDPADKKDAGIEDIAPVLASTLSSIGSAPVTTDPIHAGAGALKSGAAGAIGGALAGAKIGAVGGPVGAVGGAIIGGTLGTVLGGVDAYFKVKNSREQARAARRMRARAMKAQEKALAEARKWQKINRMDTVQQAMEDRKRRKVQDKWDSFNQARGFMFDMVNRNQSLVNNIKRQARTA